MQMLASTTHSFTSIFKDTCGGQISDPLFCAHWLSRRLTGDIVLGCRWMIETFLMRNSRRCVGLVLFTSKSCYQSDLGW